MRKKFGTVGIIVIIIALLVMWVISIYNGMVRKDEAVASAWSQVENVYQRRADLIPNLVSTVKGAADFERSTLEEVVQARASATQVKLSADELTEANVARFQAAQDALSASLGRLLVSVERYPELKATQNFTELQAQLEGTENRIAVERQKFNETVKDYNTSIRRFPANIFASMFHFDKKGYFTAKEGADQAPEVDFDFGK